MKQFASLLVLLAFTSIGFAQSSNARAEAGTCPEFPCQVASITLTSQTAAIPSTAIFTPKVAGLYRISAYMDTTPTKGSVWNYAFSWTDETKSRNSGSQQVSPGTYSFYSAPVDSAANSPISYSVGAGQNNPPGASFNIEITVEQLQ